MHADNLTLNETLILFGMDEQIMTDSGLDNIILWAKFHIYKCKMQNIAPTIQAFMSMFKNKLRVEQYLARVKGNEDKYFIKWNLYSQMNN